MALKSPSQTSPDNPREKIVILLLAVLKIYKKYIIALIISGDKIYNALHAAIKKA